MPEAGLRRALGRLCAAFGALYLLPVAFAWLSSGGPAPLHVSAHAWSAFFYAHFIALTAGGLGLQAVAAARSKLFYGGPLIDFLLGLVGFMLLETFAPAAIPGLALIAFGLRLGTGRPLLGP